MGLLCLYGIALRLLTRFPGNCLSVSPVTFPGGPEDVTPTLSERPRRPCRPIIKGGPPPGWAMQEHDRRRGSDLGVGIGCASQLQQGQPQ